MVIFLLCKSCTLQAGGDPDQSDFSGNTPLHVAASLGNAQLINLLVSGGADCTVKNVEGETPLDLAKLREHDEVVYVLSFYIVCLSLLLGCAGIREYHQ